MFHIYITTVSFHDAFLFCFDATWDLKKIKPSLCCQCLSSLDRSGSVFLSQPKNHEALLRLTFAQSHLGRIYRHVFGHVARDRGGGEPFTSTISSELQMRALGRCLLCHDGGDILESVDDALGPDDSGGQHLSDLVWHIAAALLAPLFDLYKYRWVKL